MALSCLSHAEKKPQWSFGKATRFKGGSLASSQQSTAPSLGHSKSSPAVVGKPNSGSIADAVPDHVSEVGSEDAEANGGEGDFDAEDSMEMLHYQHSAISSPSNNCWQAAHWQPKGSVKAARLDGSTERFLDVRHRQANPRAKSYEPAQTIGEGTKAYSQSPNYSFGGGKSRTYDLEKRQAQLARMAAAAGAAASQQALDQKKMAMLRALEEDKEDGTKLKKAPKLSRGFGSAVRLRHRGGPMDLPISPGPAAYEAPRNFDKVPEWVPSSLLSWGKRTAARPDLVNYTATDAGPGEYTADHPFQVSSTGPIFGHPLRELKKPNFPDPTKYNIASTIGTASSYSVGNGQRSGLGGGFGKTPGPAHYNPAHNETTAHAKHAVFGTCERRHAADDVDPDEPPGPGTHKIRKDPKPTDKPSAGLPQEAKMKQFPGMGPVGYPSPGDYEPKLSKATSKSMHLPCPKKIEQLPGPTDYEPSVELSTEAQPAWAPLANRTAIRKSPFDVGSSGTDKSSDALLRRAAAAAAETAQQEGYGDPHAARLAFAAQGPKYSLAARRPMVHPQGHQEKPFEHCKTMYGASSSMG